MTTTDAAHATKRARILNLLDTFTCVTSAQVAAALGIEQHAAGQALSQMASEKRLNANPVRSALRGDSRVEYSRRHA